MTKQALAPAKMRRDLEMIKRAAGYTRCPVKGNDELKPWPADVFLHAGITSVAAARTEKRRSGQATLRRPSASIIRAV